jgi:two-component system CheB/CheR fusion protein
MERRVLIVEDHAESAVGLEELIRMLGHEVDVALDGSAALELARRNPPDIALLDISLPGMDGFELAREMRRLPEGQRILLVALTGHRLEEDRAQATEAGFDHHLVKPVDPDVLQRLLAAGIPGKDA